MTYDDWKLATPKEYEEDAPPAQPYDPNKDRKRCAGCGGWTDGRHLDRALLPTKEDDDVAF